MTEFEVATIAFQEATVAFQKATLAFQESTVAFQESSLALQESSLAVGRTGLWISGAHVVATVVIGLGQIAVVWYGIRAMMRAGERREREHERRHAESMRRFDVQARALETLIERTAPAPR